MLTLHAPESIDQASSGRNEQSPVDEPASNVQSTTQKEEASDLLEVTEDEATPDPVDEETEPADEEERRFWMEIEVLGKIADCTRNIENTEAEIEHFKSQQKDAKDFLKGEMIRLRRLGSELTDIIEGKPLPELPKKEEPKPPAATEDSATAAEESDEWQATPTSELLEGVKGLGDKKLEAIVELAPTAGKLEELRGEASKACKPFKDMLPKGCGQNLSDAIEDRLVELVAKRNTPPASEQVEPRVDETPKSPELASQSPEHTTEPQNDASSDVLSNPPDSETNQPNPETEPPDSETDVDLIKTSEEDEYEDVEDTLEDL